MGIGGQKVNIEYLIRSTKKIIVFSCAILFVLITVHYSLVRPKPVIKPTKHHNADYTRIFSHNKPIQRRRQNDTREKVNKTLVELIQKFQYRPKHGPPKQVHLTPQSAVNTTEIRRIFMKSWRKNDANINAFRSELNEHTNTREYFAMNQENVKAGENLTMAHQDQVSRAVLPDIHEWLPKESPFKGTSLSRCVVMGSSGILTGSHCGHEIDETDYVFRCNMPPIDGYRDDAGSRSNLTTMNVMSIVTDRYHLLSTSHEEDHFLRDLSEYSGYLWLPVFGMGSTYSFGLRVFRLAASRLNETDLHPIVGHPNHFRAVKKFWEKRGIIHRPSTGLYLTTTAIALCDKVDLYGFWPLPRDLHNNHIPYHYYGNKQAPTIMHDFHLEFFKLAHLHEQGIIEMHTGECKDQTKSKKKG